jgi:high-affinity nickel-transport protein
MPVVTACALGFVLGVRHGLDWDHLSAITDIVGSAGRRGARSLGLALWYCIGHGLVIVLLGALVGILGVRLPGGIDRVFEVVVGLTLVALGVLVLAQVWRRRGEYRFSSRWRVLIDLLRRAWRLRQGDAGSDAPAPLSRRTAFGIGILHGTGAETPTQVVLFASAAAAGSAGGAGLVLLAFVAGLVVSDVGVALLWLGGRLASIRLPGAQLALGIVTGLASVGVGVTFIVAKSAALPALFGG